MPEHQGTTTSDESTKKRYDRMTRSRDPFVKRAEVNASLTIPSLFPKNQKDTDSSEQPWQSIGARGVNNLASKAILSLFPPNTPFFRLVLDRKTLAELEEGEDKEQSEKVKTELDNALATVEQIVADDFESTNARASAFEAMRQLLVAGNVLWYETPAGEIKVFRLDQYVVKRNGEGKPTEIIVREEIEWQDLDQKLRDLLTANAREKMTKEEMLGKKKLELFTRVWLDRKSSGGRIWRTSQEIKKMEVPGAGSFPADAMPWNPLRMIQRMHSSYGGSLVEEYIGDLLTVDSLSESIAIAVAAGAKIVFLNNPNGMTRTEDLVTANSGDFIEGTATDVTAVQVNKAVDLNVARQTMVDVQQRLMQAFLLPLQRQAERVTAEEIRFVAEELENALGGVYQTLALEWQEPVVRFRMRRLQKKGVIPTLPKDSVRPVIITGLDALGRGNDLHRIRGFLADILPLGEEAVAVRINMSGLIERFAAGHGVNLAGLIKSEEEVQQEQAAAQQASMMNKLQETATAQAIATTGKVTENVASEAGVAPTP